MRKTGSKREKLQKDRGKEIGRKGEGVKEGKKQKENILFLLTISGNETWQKAGRETKMTKAYE